MNNPNQIRSNPLLKLLYHFVVIVYISLSAYSCYLGRHGFSIFMGILAWYFLVKMKSLETTPQNPNINQ